MSYDDVVKCYDQAAALSTKFKRKGKTMPYTSANGYMFSLVNKEGQLGIRLPKEEQANFIAKYESGPFLSHGATMRDYVLIPKSLLDDAKLVAAYLEKGFDFVMSLPPK